MRPATFSPLRFLKGTLVRPALLLSFLLALAVPAQAQETTTLLKASYRGTFLPKGTAVVVLHKPAALRQDDLYQPEFVGRDAFPLQPGLLLRRDTLDGWHQTRTRYPKTQHSGKVYFLYALAPDSTLYWSFSNVKDALKFDVVDRGVMAVAPVTAPDVRAAVMRAFFRPSVPVATAPRTPRVTVVLRGDSIRDAARAAAGAPVLSDTAALAALPADTMAAVDTTRTADLPAVAAAPIAPTQAAPPAPGIVLSYTLFYSLLGFLLVLIGTLAYFAHVFRRDLAESRTILFNLRMQLSTALAHPDRPAENDALAAAEQAREQAEQNYAILKARYNALRRDLEAKMVREE